MGFVETAHAPPFVALGGSVWEASGGPRVPLNARNVQSVSERLEAVEPSSIVARLREEEQRTPFSTPDGASMRALRVTPDVVQTDGMDVGRLLSSQGTGLLTTSRSPAVCCTTRQDHDAERVVSPPGRAPSAQPAAGHEPGITVKDSPQSTLVFVTRLGIGAPVATRAWRSSTRQQDAMERATIATAWPPPASISAGPPRLTIAFAVRKRRRHR